MDVGVLVPLALAFALGLIVGVVLGRLSRREAAREVKTPAPRLVSASSPDRTLVGMPQDVASFRGPAVASDATVVVPADRGETTAARAEPAATVVVRAGPRARLSVTTGGSGSFDLADKEYAIGRSSSNDVVLADPSVSGHHARLLPHPEGFLIRDLESTNGTTVNGRPVSGDQLLRGGEVVGLGDVVLRYERLPR